MVSETGPSFFVAGGVFFAADVLQRQMHCCWQRYLFAAVGGVKWPPPAAISRQKCGRRHFESAIRRENTAKSWQVDISFAFHRPRLSGMSRLCHMDVTRLGFYPVYCSGRCIAVVRCIAVDSGIFSRQLEGSNGLRRPRFPGKSVAVGILKVPSGAKIQQNRGRWTYLLPSTRRGCQECPASAAWMSLASVSSRCIAAADVLLLAEVSFRGSWRGQMASAGRDFPAKVWPSAF